jgi:hypothetical protein
MAAMVTLSDLPKGLQFSSGRCIVVLVCTACKVLFSFTSPDPWSPDPWSTDAIPGKNIAIRGNPIPRLQRHNISRVLLFVKTAG